MWLAVGASRPRASTWLSSTRRQFKTLLEEYQTGMRKEKCDAVMSKVNGWLAPCLVSQRKSAPRSSGRDARARDETPTSGVVCLDVASKTAHHANTKADCGKDARADSWLRHSFDCIT